MREITTHRVEGKGGGKDTTRVFAVDEPGNGGACHHYQVVAAEDGKPWYHLSEFGFQNGPIQEVGCNGVQLEHLLAIAEDRLRAFQEGPFANEYNAEALGHVIAAMSALHRRTTDRLARGVEGHNKA